MHILCLESGTQKIRLFHALDSAKRVVHTRFSHQRVADPDIGRAYAQIAMDDKFVEKSYREKGGGALWRINKFHAIS